MEETFSYGWPGIRKFFRKNLVAILYTLIFHLVVLIILVFVKVQGLKQDTELGIRIEFEEKTVDDIMQKEKMEVPAEWLQEVLARRKASSNRAVNVNAEQGFNKEISTDDYVNDLLEQIEKARDEQDREKLEELQAILAAADYVPPAEDSEEKKQGDFTGPTTITYEFLDEPTKRGRMNLTIPVYRCQGSGFVRVAVTVATDGSVTTAEIVEPIEGSDKVCFADAALEAARTSRFRIDLKAPSKQRAVITYAFVAQ